MLAKLEISSEFVISEFCFSVLLMKKSPSVLGRFDGLSVVWGEPNGLEVNS